jgi:hypothetical protein
MNYLTLLEEAVALLDADRAFVVLYDSATGVPNQYVATHNFDPALLLQPPGEEFTEHDHMRELLPAIFAAARPILTDNSMTASYYCRKIRVTDWILRCIIALPLREGNAVNGLLWCDKSVRVKGLWTQQGLEKAAALVERFQESG